jgi:flagellar basal-body rod protein FlgB
MSISFEKALGIHEQAVNVRVKRAEILANNLANADTPGFKARDMDFRAALKGAMNPEQGLAMAKTNVNHIGPGTSTTDADLLYRNPSQPSIDGNTVDTQVEMANYLKNSMDYEASFQFLNSKFKGLTNAIRGD